VDPHVHCPCNGVWLCTTCHGWVHQHPFEAKTKGFIVSRHIDQPGAIPIDTVRGRMVFGCDGTFVSHLGD
jgi:hypothetical protein